MHFFFLWKFRESEFLNLLLVDLDLLSEWVELLYIHFALFSPLLSPTKLQSQPSIAPLQCVELLWLSCLVRSVRRKIRWTMKWYNKMPEEKSSKKCRVERALVSLGVVKVLLQFANSVWIKQHKYFEMVRISQFLRSYLNSHKLPAFELLIYYRPMHQC